MANPLAIGAVSSTLQALLEDRMDLPDGVRRDQFNVTVGLPPRVETRDGALSSEAPRVNVFLYRVSENPHLKNQPMPGRGDGASYGHPPLSLVLHYLVTAYGTTEDRSLFNETQSHFLLGSAMRVLHDFPVVTPRLLRERKDPVGTPILHESLRDEAEHVKLGLDPVPLEEISKVWTALTQAYRVCAAYSASVVQVESRRPSRFPRPVGEVGPASGPRVFTVPLRTPTLEAVTARWRVDGGDPFERTTPMARVGDTLLLHGAGFDAPSLAIELGGIRIPVAPASANLIEVAVPDDALPDGTAIAPERRLQPGVHPVTVVAAFGGLPAAGFRSNLSAFMLVPGLDGPEKADDPAAPRTLKLKGTRLHHARLSGETLVGRFVVPRSAYGATPSSTLLEFPIPDLLAAWPARCLLSGPVAPWPPDPAADWRLRISIGASGPFVATFATPEGLQDVPRLMEPAIRRAAGEGAPPQFTDARVGIVGDRIAILPGRLRDSVAVADDGANPTATKLSLTPAKGAKTERAFLTGHLDPFPAITSRAPRLSAKMGAGPAKTVALPARPGTLAEAAAALQAALAAPAAFPGTRAAPLGAQILILPPPGFAGDAFSFGEVPGVDPTTAAELQLCGNHTVRHRVNGAESLEARTVSLP